MNKRILILCTGNSCRSQMAEAVLKKLMPEAIIDSAGTEPEKEIHPMAIQVMREIGLEPGSHQPKSVDQFLNQDFDYVITVCDHARESCPIFNGRVKQRLHFGFMDPTRAVGTDEEKLVVFKRIRDQIRDQFEAFCQKISDE